VEYFELYGPSTTTQYSEVYWQPQAVPLPADIVSRFAGRVMGVTGYEVDIVRTVLAPNGTVISEETVMPFEIYNHHYTGPSPLGSSSGNVQASCTERV